MHLKNRGTNTEIGEGRNIWNPFFLLCQYWSSHERGCGRGVTLSDSQILND